MDQLPLLEQLPLVGQLSLFGQLPMVTKGWLTIVDRVQSPLERDQLTMVDQLPVGEGSVRSSGAKWDSGAVAQGLELQTLDKKRTRVRIVCRSDEH